MLVIKIEERKIDQIIYNQIIYNLLFQLVKG